MDEFTPSSRMPERIPTNKRVARRKAQWTPLTHHNPAIADA
jgi:hypothetical protein